VPELPDVTLYVEHLARRVTGRTLRRVRIAGINLLRTVDPSPDAAEGRAVRDVRRVGKRIAIATDGGPWLVIHLMIAGRLHWADAAPGEDAREPALRGGRNALAAFGFESGTLTLTEAGTKRRASLHVVDDAGLAVLDPGGIEPLGADSAALRAALLRENHTLKRALTDPRLVSGIGNAYSDEILHRAQLSPMRQARQLDDAEWERLHAAVRDVLVEWTDRLRAEAGERFPEKVTAFRPEMAVHGRYRQPCPRCGAPVQRIVYAENECNYCARCQTGGRVLADRSLSRLLHDDWPRRIEELEEAMAARAARDAPPPAPAPRTKRRR